MPQNSQENRNIQLDPQMGTKFKRVSSMTSLAAFPCNITVYGQNPEEKVLLFVRMDKIILVANLFVQTLVFFMPFVLRYILSYINATFANKAFDFDLFFNSKYWLALILLWCAYVLKGYYNIFIKWYYDVNVLTTNRFLDIDMLGVFKHRLEETSILNIEDAKDTQSGVLQAVFEMGDLEIFTASGQTSFNLPNVPNSNKIRDFIMDVVVEERKKYGDDR